MSKCENTLCFISSKGGSGKTVTASALGIMLSSLGLRVLLIDTDASTNGMTLLFLEHMLRRSKLHLNSHGVGLFEAEEGVAPTKITIGENLDFIPAAFRLRNTETFPIPSFKRALWEALKRTDDYHIVLIDAQAGTDGYAQIAAEISNTHIIVSEYDPVSAQGIDRLKLIFAAEMSASSTYTLFNKVLPEFASVIGEGLAIARYLPPIPWDADVVRAFARRDLAIMMDAPNPYTLAVSQVALACLPDVAGGPIERWRNSVLSRSTDPIKQRLRNLTFAREAISAHHHKAMLYSTFAKTVPLGLLAIASVYGSFMKRFPHNISKVMQELDVRVVFGVVALSMISVAIMIWSEFYRRKRRSFADEISDLDEEIQQLRTAMIATESTLRVNPPGPFEKFRRGMSA